MHQCDVLIVGGGPAGSTLAWNLRHSGLAVTILDQRTFPRDKICAGWVTPEVIDELEIDVEAYRKEHTFQPITGFRISVLGRRQLELKYPGPPVSYGIRRIEFDDYLLGRCQAKLLLGQACKTMERNGSGWLVNGEIQAGLVVGAGGHFCPVARTVSPKPKGGELAVAAQEVEFELTPKQKTACRIEPEIPELFFLPELNGYGWAFRKGDHLNIGLGREDRETLSRHVQAFRDHLVESGKLPPDIPSKFKGHGYLLYHHAVREMIHDGVLLIGDSAGLAYPESGEGIRPAVESAMLAAPVIQAAGGDYRRENLMPYYETLTQRLGARQPRPSLVEKFPMALKRLMAGPLMQNRWFARKILVEQWFLHRDVPALPRVGGAGG